MCLIALFGDYQSREWPSLMTRALSGRHNVSGSGKTQKVSLSRKRNNCRRDGNSFVRSFFLAAVRMSFLEQSKF